MGAILPRPGPAHRPVESAAPPAFRYHPLPLEPTPNAPPPMPLPEKAPDPARKSALAFFAVLLLLLLPDMLAQGVSPAFGLAFGELFTMLLPALAAAAGSNLRPGPYLGFTSARPLPILFGALLGAAGFVAANGVMALWVIALPHSVLDRFPDVAQIFHGTHLTTVAVTLSAVILAPLCEEAVFRGFLQRTLALRHRPAAAVTLAATLFAVRHLDPVRFPALLLLGILFGLLSWRAGSLWPAIAAHAVNNVAAASLALWARPTGVESTMPTVRMALSSLFIGGATVALLVFWFWRTTPAPPALQGPLPLRDPQDPSIQFRLHRLPRSLSRLFLLGVFLLWVLVALHALKRTGWGT